MDKCRWLEAVPKNQLIGIKINCDSEQDFETQSNIIICCFIERGYQEHKLNRVKQQVRNIIRE